MHDTQVMFVDFGDEEWVREQNLRQLDDRFLPLPPQAVECCLAGVGPPPSHETWPDTSRYTAEDMVYDWECKPCYDSVCVCVYVCVCVRACV